MIVQQARWADLGVGSYIVGKDGVTWRVTKTAGAPERLWLAAESTDGATVRMPPRDPNALVSILCPTEEEAVATLGAVLGAGVIEDAARVDTDLSV